MNHNSTPVGFEPTRGDPIGLAGRRLDRSAKVSSVLEHKISNTEPNAGHSMEWYGTFLAFISLQVSSLQPLASNLKPPASSLQPQASSLKPPASSLQPRLSRLQSPVASRQDPTSNNQTLPISCSKRAYYEYRKKQAKTEKSRDKASNVTKGARDQARDKTKIKKTEFHELSPTLSLQLLEQLADSSL